MLYPRLIVGENSRASVTKLVQQGSVDATKRQQKHQSNRIESAREAYWVV